MCGGSFQCVYVCTACLGPCVSNVCTLVSVFIRSGIENLKRKKLRTSACTFVCVCVVSVSEGLRYSMKKNYCYLPGRREKRGRDKKPLHLTESARETE